MAITGPESAAKGAAGWRGLFWDAFKRSRNAMVLVDELRVHVEVNGAYLQLTGYERAQLIGRPVYDFLAGGPVMSNEQALALIARGEFTGTAELVRADGRQVRVQYAAHPETVTGRRLVLLVVVGSSFRARRRPVAPVGRALSEREREVIRLVALGWSGPEIGTELDISHNTVRTHVANAMTKLGARTRAQLVAKSLAGGVAHRERAKSSD
jgi:PAS domain S-box-containing protein